MSDFDNVPDFDNPLPVGSSAEKPARKKPVRRRAKKALVRKARRVVPAAPKKRKVAKKARRGRPPGSKNKSKVGERLIASVRQASNRIKAGIESPAPVGARAPVVTFIEHVLGVSVAPWQAEILAKLLNKAD